MWKEDHAAGAQMVITAHSKNKKRSKTTERNNLWAMDDGALMPKLVLYHLCPLKHSSIRNPKAAYIVEQKYLNAILRNGTESIFLL